jgi:hypothetical protein
VGSWALAAAWALTACASDPAPEAGDRLSALVVAETIPPASLDQRPWAPTRCQPGALAPDVLACVDGAAITRAAFDRVRALAPAELGNRALIDALIRAEVLAGEALRRGLWSDWLTDGWRSALVRRLLRQRFVEAFGPAQVREADLARAWRRAPIRNRYAHEHAWLATDAQFLCCTGSAQECEISAAAAKCAEAAAAKAALLYAELRDDPPASEHAFRARVELAAGRLEGLSVQDVSFYYDPEKRYDQQGDYDLMVEPWALAVTALRPGQLSPPIRTPFGWHVARLNQHLPRKAGTLADPEVRLDLASGILDGVRERDVQLFAVALMRARGVTLRYEALELAGSSPR